jgi:mRNA-degrading endonuclease RelE of RelBE toxin-antitoxin system
MLIVETPVFTRRVLDALTDDEYRKLQEFLAQYPDAGNVIPGSGGLRKLRWAISGKDKRGGTRIVYYWLRAKDIILTKDQLKTLKAIVTREFQ